MGEKSKYVMLEENSCLIFFFWGEHNLSLAELQRRKSTFCFVKETENSGTVVFWHFPGSMLLVTYWGDLEILSI